MESSLIVIVVCAVVIVLGLFYSKRQRAGTTKGSTTYHYGRKDYLMTQAESSFFKILIEAFGSNYYIFPQVHLSSILDERKVTGQNWKAAFRHINEKSVDYVICSKADFKPLVAIELDDSTHYADDRQSRDVEVKRIFDEAKIPLVRFTNRESTSKMDVERRISVILNS